MYVAKGSRAPKHFCLEDHRRMRIWVNCTHINPLIQFDFIEVFTTIMRELKNSSYKFKFGFSKLWN